MSESSQQTRKPLQVEQKKSDDPTQKSDNSTTRDENEITNMFCNNLAEIFKPEIHTFVYENNLELPLPINNPDPISIVEFISSLKTLNPKTAPGIDQISNKQVFKNCADRFITRILTFSTPQLNFYIYLLNGKFLRS